MGFQTGCRTSTRNRPASSEGLKKIECEPRVGEVPLQACWEVWSPLCQWCLAKDVRDEWLTTVSGKMCVRSDNSTTPPQLFSRRECRIHMRKSAVFSV